MPDWHVSRHAVCCYWICYQCQYLDQSGCEGFCLVHNKVEETWIHMTVIRNTKALQVSVSLSHDEFWYTCCQFQERKFRLKLANRRHHKYLQFIDLNKCLSHFFLAMLLKFQTTGCIFNVAFFFSKYNCVKNNDFVWGAVQLFICHMITKFHSHWSDGALKIKGKL